MALRKRGKSGYWHAYFRKLIATPSGRLRASMVTVNLGTADRKTAEAMEHELMTKNRTARLHQRYLAHLAVLQAEASSETAGAPLPEAALPPIHTPRHKRLKLADALTTAAKYKDISDSQRKIFSRFVREIGVTYADEVTQERAYLWLSSRFSGKSQGKTYNNNRTALNAVFKVLLLDSGLSESPFARVPVRRHTAVHQRPFTEDEFIRIYTSAPEPWKTASLIAWYTGLREKDVFLLQWSNIHDDVIVTTPAKTARFGRSVRIPIHPQLQQALDGLPHTGDRVLGAWSYTPNSGDWNSRFTRLLERLHITANTQGIVTFNSFRDSFVTRCDAAGIPRHAIRGIVGHTSDTQTDLYSHDLTTARRLQHLPWTPLSKSQQT